MPQTHLSRRSGHRHRLHISSRSRQANPSRRLGIFQGTPELSDRNYKPLPTDPKTIDYAVLTHAISTTPVSSPPRPRRHRATIFANPATIELTILLLKTPRTCREDALHAKEHRTTAFRCPAALHLEDVDPALRAMKPMPRAAA